MTDPAALEAAILTLAPQLLNKKDIAWLVRHLLITGETDSRPRLLFGDSRKAKLAGKLYTDLANNTDLSLTADGVRTFRGLLLIVAEAKLNPPDASPVTVKISPKKLAENAAEVFLVATMKKPGQLIPADFARRGPRPGHGHR